MTKTVIFGLCLTLTACAAPTPVVRQNAPPPKQSARLTDTRGLEAVMGRSAGELTRLFGEPRLNIIEGDARKLQFGNASCVLDTYLYPDGAREPVVTYLDARTPDGRDADRASCVTALRR